MLHNTSEEDFLNIWYIYFDLGRDYGEIKSKLSKMILLCKKPLTLVEEFDFKTGF